MEIYLSYLSNQLYKGFSKNELKQMCFELEIEWEEVEDNSKSITIITLLKYLVRRSQLDSLIEYCRVSRPNLDWDRLNLERVEVQSSSPSPIENDFPPPLFYTLVDEVEKNPLGHHVLGKLFNTYYELQQQKISEEEFASYVLSLLTNNKLKFVTARQFLTVIGYDVLEDGQSYILVKENKNE